GGRTKPFRAAWPYGAKSSISLLFRAYRRRTRPRICGSQPLCAHTIAQSAETGKNIFQNPLYKPMGLCYNSNRNKNYYCFGGHMESTRKHSRKRDAILDCMRSTTCHPTAEWVYQQLKPVFPDLSLGTVYRNLAMFKAN